MKIIRIVMSIVVLTSLWLYAEEPTIPALVTKDEKLLSITEHTAEEHKEGETPQHESTKSEGKEHILEEANKPTIESTQSTPEAPVDSLKAPSDTMQLAGLNTADKASGNWVLKKQYWEEAQTTFEKIRNINDALLKKQMDYVDINNEIEKKVDTAFSTVGFDRGELVELLDALNERMEQERKERGDLSEPERAFLQTLKEQQQAVEALQHNLKAAGEIDDAIQQSLKTVTEQIKQARSYENKAWLNFKKIGEILSHEQAHDLFYEIHGYYVSVQKIAEYINKALWKTVNDNAQKVDQELSSIESSVSTLQAKGVDLTKEMESFKKTDEQIEQERKQQEEEAKKRALEKAAQAKKKSSTGFMGFVSAIWLSIAKFFNTIFGYITFWK